MTIIRDQKLIPDTSTADLIETYNALTGKSIKKFSARAAGEVQVANAIMAAQDRAGHLGVPKGARPVAITEAEAAAKEKAKNASPVVATPEPVGSPKPLREKLAAAAGTAPPHAKREGAAPVPRKGAVSAVRVTGRGAFRLQAASMRAKVMAAAGTGTVQVAELIALLGDGAKGAVATLLKHDHLEAAE